MWLIYSLLLCGIALAGFGYFMFVDGIEADNMEGDHVSNVGCLVALIGALVFIAGISFAIYRAAS